MFLSAVIVAFLLGAVITLVVQYVFFRRWLSHQPHLYPPYKQQFEKFDLPQFLRKHLRCKDNGLKGDSNTRPGGWREDQSLVLNMLMQFLFAELKDTARVRRWTARKLNVEFNEMLATTLGKFIDQIQVRDFSFGSSFPVVKGIQLQTVDLKDDDIIRTIDVALDVVYDGGFQLTLDVDLVFGAWAYLSVTVTKLEGKARLQFTRTPFTHWSFAFYEEPKMEFEVDSRFNGRPIPQISSLIVNQIKRTIRKKHILPSYKMRYKPLFVKPEESFVNPELSLRGEKLWRGRLTVKVLKCSRLQELSGDSKLYCTLSVDKEDMEEVWRQSWSTIQLELNILPNGGHGIMLKDQISFEKNEKKRVIVEGILLGSPGDVAGLQRGDILESVGNVRVLSFKHAEKQIRNSGERVFMKVRRRQERSIPDELQFQEHLVSQEGEDKDLDPNSKDDLSDFVNICVTDDKSRLDQESQKPTDKITPKKAVTTILQTGKRKLLGNKDVDEDVSDTSSVKFGQIDDDTMATAEAVSMAAAIMKDRSQSAKSSPQKQVLGMKRQRAHSDTSLHKASDAECHSLPGDIGCYSYQSHDKRTGQVSTREVDFSADPEWNEEFEFDCNYDDQFVNVCVWCKVAQTAKQIASSKSDTQQKSTPPTDDLPQYDVMTKIGYVSIPLADISAGCLLTLQGDTEYTLYLQPPDENITASRTKPPYSGHAGFDKTICHGDISLSFVHVPEYFPHPLQVEMSNEERRSMSRERSRIISEIINPKPAPPVTPGDNKEQDDGRHRFKAAQFPSGTYCNFCGKKIWLKGALLCDNCEMVCHKKCVEKCQMQTNCTRDGPMKAGRTDERWVPPVRGGDADKDEGKSGVGIFRKLRNRDHPSLPLNIPNKQGLGRISPMMSPSRSPLRSPSPFGQHHVGDSADGHLSAGGLRRSRSNSSVGNTDREDDSDDEALQKGRPPGYSLDDNVVIEAKEKGKELHADLSLPERKQKLDDMVTKLQGTIDKESEYKAELLKVHQDSTDPDQKRILSQQLEKSDEKMEALMMMMVHYCAGLQHCLDQEEAHRRLKSMEQAVDPVDPHDDSGIQFVVTDVEN